MTSKQFCLKWNNFQSNILHAFESLQNTEDLADVTLTCEGLSVRAHKFILSACSPYFRTVFKENPCSHPIIILKDVLYIDLVAIINFMYHGEVLVSEEQLASFLQTAKLLQVSGLNNDGPSKKTPPQRKLKVQRNAESPEYSPVKKLKAAIKPKVSKVISPNSDSSCYSNSQREGGEGDRSDEERFADVNENVEVVVNDKCEQGSILEAALEVSQPKAGSILERSLTSHSIAGKSPSSQPFAAEQLGLPEVPKSVFVPRKPPELDPEKRSSVKTTSSGSCSPLAFDRPPVDILQQTIKIEEDPYDSNDTVPDDLMQKESIFQVSRTVDVQPHHSSQCGNCPHCGKVYSNQSALKYHVRLVHSDLTNMYCCHLCPEAFDYREGYKKHMVEVHCVRN